MLICADPKAPAAETSTVLSKAAFATPPTACRTAAHTTHSPSQSNVSTQALMAPKCDCQLPDRFLSYSRTRRAHRPPRGVRSGRAQPAAWQPTPAVGSARRLAQARRLSPLMFRASHRAHRRYRTKQTRGHWRGAKSLRVRRAGWPGCERLLRVGPTPRRSHMSSVHHRMSLQHTTNTVHIAHG